MKYEKLIHIGRDITLFFDKLEYDPIIDSYFTCLNNVYSGTIPKRRIKFIRIDQDKTFDKKTAVFRLLEN